MACHSIVFGARNLYSLNNPSITHLTLARRYISGDLIVVPDGKIVSNTFVSSAEDQYASFEKVKQLKPMRFICPGHGHVRSFSVQDI